MRRTTSILIAFAVVLALTVAFAEIAGPQVIYRSPPAVNNLEDKYPPIDSLYSVVTWCYDDGDHEWLDSLGIFLTAAAFTGVEQTATAFVHSSRYLHPDLPLNSSYLTTVAQLESLYAHGWEIANHSYQGLTAWDAGADGYIGSGRFENHDSLETLVAQGVRAIRDTMGFPHPKSFSYPQSSAHVPALKIIAKYHECATSANNPSNDYGTRRLYPEPLSELYGASTVNIASQFADLQQTSDYEIPHVLADVTSKANFEAIVLDGVAHRGTWIIQISHKPSLMTDISMSERIRFVDSLVNRNELRVMNFYDAFEYFRRRPISGNANRIHEELRDRDGDGRFDFVWLGDIADAFVTSYPDSVYDADLDGNSVSGSDNFGYAGKGYATLDWDGQGWLRQAEPFENRRRLSFRYPFDGEAGDMMVFEFYAQVDTAGYGAIAGDSLGVQFLQYIDLLRGDGGRFKYSGGWVDPATVSDSPLRMISPYASSINDPDIAGSDAFHIHAQEFQGNEVVGNRWFHFVSRCPVMPGASLVEIAVSKDSALPSGAVRVSNWSFRILPKSRY